MDNNLTLNHRNDIDVLRGISVLIVVFFHFKFPFFNGGFIGVDVFFVISGFLISRIILYELNQNIFSVTKFYIRRILRIFPALFTVFVFTTICSLFLLDYESLKFYSKALTFSSLFISNIFFWRELGYFDTTSDFNPLLHTWSLSVEEQFYLLLPILFLVSIKKKFLFSFFFFSLITCFSITYISPNSAFYLPITRLWEFGIGTILAFLPPVSIKDQLLIFYRILGYSLIAIGVLFYNNSIVFPGLWVLLPTSGAFLIIYFGEKKIHHYTLILQRPLMLIGKISYSLYLIHWPAYVFVLNLSFGKISNINYFLLLSGTFLLSYLSWRFIEIPARQMVNQNKKKIFGVAFFSVFFMVLLARVIYLNNGFPQRYLTKDTFELIENDKYWNNIKEHEINQRENPKVLNFIPLGSNSSSVNFILWGDSHARSLAYGINEETNNRKIKGILASMSSTPPIIESFSNELNAEAEYNKNILEYILKSDSLKTVILACKWNYYINLQSTNANKTMNTNTPNSFIFFHSLKKTIDRLLVAGKNVVIVNSIPKLKFDIKFILPKIKYEHFFNISQSSYLMSENDYKKWNTDFNIFLNTFKKGERSSQFFIVYPEEVLSKHGMMIAFHESLPLYRDDNHLSIIGSLIVSKNICKIAFK